MTSPELYEIAADDLETELLGDEPPWDEEPAAPPDPGRAEALLRRLRRLEAERDADAEIALRQAEQIQRWVERREEPRRRRREWISRSLRAYHEGVFARSRTATISLPSGQLISRQQPAVWEIDEEAFMAWAQENQPDLIVTPRPTTPPPRLDRNGVKSFLTRKDEKGKVLALGVTPDGIVPPGVSAVPGARNYDIKLNDRDEDE